MAPWSAAGSVCRAPTAMYEMRAASETSGRLQVQVAGQQEHEQDQDDQPGGRPSVIAPVTARPVAAKQDRDNQQYYQQGQETHHCLPEGTALVAHRRGPPRTGVCRRALDLPLGPASLAPGLGVAVARGLTLQLFSLARELVTHPCHDLGLPSPGKRRAPLALLDERLNAEGMPPRGLALELAGSRLWRTACGSGDQ